MVIAAINNLTTWLRGSPTDRNGRSFEVRRRLHEAVYDDARYRRLDRYHAFYLGLEYAHLTKNWDGQPIDRVDAISPDCAGPVVQLAPGQKTSIHDLRPTAPQRLTPMIVDRFTGLLFSEDRLPTIEVEGDEDADDWLKAAFKQARFWRVMTMARTFGGAMGSSLVTVRLRNGRLSYTARSGKVVHDIAWAEDDEKIPAGVLIQYVFTREVAQIKDGRPTGRTEDRRYIYRRIIDEHADVVFKPALYTPGATVPELEVDEHRSYEHGLGRFPGVWIQNLPAEDPMEGLSDCEGMFQTMQMIDIQVSQTNKALINNQDPTLVFGRDMKLEQLKIPLQKGSENSLNVGMGGHASYLEMGAGAQGAASEFVRSQKQHVYDKTQCVVPDRDDPSFGAQSGKALEFRYAMMLEKGGRLREQYGEAIEHLADLTLEMARTFERRPEYQGRRGVVHMKPRLIEIDNDPANPDPKAGRRYEQRQRTPGVGGVVNVVWGPYFAKTETDTQLRISNVSQAHSTGRIDGETVTRELVKALELKDVNGILRRVREDEAIRQQQQFDMMGGFPAPEEVQFGPDGQPMFEPPGEAPGAEPGQSAPDAPVPAGQAGGAPLAAIALNGAQIQSAKSIVTDVAAGILPRESGMAMLRHWFSMSPEAAEEIMGPVGLTFRTTPGQAQAVQQQIKQGNVARAPEPEDVAPEDPFPPPPEVPPEA